MRRPARTARFSWLCLLAASVLLAGCLGRLRPSPSQAPVTADSVQVDSAGVDSAAADSIAAVALADSLAGDSLRTDTTAVDTLVQQDTITADSARRVAVPAAPAGRPARECLFDFTESPPESRLVTNRLNDGTRVTFIGGGFVGRCQGDPQTISADSAEQYESIGLVIMRGNVVFDEPGEVRITAPTATYFTREEKLVADGGVVATQIATGSTFTGPMLEYYRAFPGIRDKARIYAPMRPTVRLIERDSAGVEQPPVLITSDQMEDGGDNVLAAWGRVEIERTSITGQADTASFNQLTERARLIRNAFITSRDTVNPFRLVGDTIDLFSTDRVLERVVALHEAQASSNDLIMRAENVELQLEEQVVARTYAWGAGRATAETSVQSLEADSIYVDMPDQVVRELHAVGRATAVGMPDTTRIRLAERDVLRGDTVIARFDTVTTPPDTAPKSVLKEVLATVEASSLYQVPSNRGPDFPPALNYARGHSILVSFTDGEVQSVLVDSMANGIYLEPVQDSLAEPPAAGGARTPPPPVIPPSDIPPTTTTAFDPHAIMQGASRRRTPLRRTGAPIPDARSVVPSPALYRP